MFDERLGIIVGSLLSGVLGYLVLRYSLPPAGEEVESVKDEVEQVV